MSIETDSFLHQFIKPKEQNYYDILEVSPEAPQNEVREAFERAKKTYNPDNPALYSMFSKEEATELLRMAEEAFSVLGNYNLRKSYDEKIKKQYHQQLEEKPSSPIELDSVEHHSFDNPLDHHELTANTIPESMTFDSIESLSEENVKFGKTKITTYSIDPVIEEEINSQIICDGLFLKMVREYKNVSLEQISNQTKISRKYLRAIEDNDFTVLPAPVFLRGFVVQITKILDLNVEKVLKFYLDSYKEFIESQKN